MPAKHLALVTGAGRGIGRAIAQHLARAGAAVLVSARSQEACLEAADEIRELGGTAWALHLDVTDPDSIRDALDEARERGNVDWLVNNAGIAISAPFLEHGRASGVDLYEQHLATNFHGARRLIEALVPGMIQRGYGRVVNLASSAGLQGYAYAAAYCASKHALVGYSLAAANELSRTGVTLNLVCPHYVDSPMTDASVRRIVERTGRSQEETRRLLASQNPGGTLVMVEEVAQVTLDLLVSNRNGSIVELIGGRGSRPLEETVRWR